jgi:2-(1,2-epoxy-1,2-dihydrophenyl)acetyl-CoA isomerase
MELDTGTETVLAEIVDGVGLLTLNRPERRNALHPDMYRAVPITVERFIRHPDVGCILISGAGTAFCAGGDVRDGARRDKAAGDGGETRPPNAEDGGTALARNARMVTVLHSSPKITMAALPGPAVGAGLGIALSTDLRIAARSATLVPGWGALAFSGDFGGTWFLTRLLGPSTALEILLDNTTIDAESARALGLVNRVVDDDDLRASALDWARSIAAGPRTAHRYMKANVQQAERLTLEEALPLESERMARSAGTDDHRAAVKQWMARATAKKADEGSHR